MNNSAKDIAENATFQAFVNSYVREVSTGFWMELEEWVAKRKATTTLSGTHMLEVELEQQGVTYALEIKYRSRAGRHIIGGALKYCVRKNQWIAENRLTVMITMIQEVHLLASVGRNREFTSHFDELMLRVIASYQTMATYIEGRLGDSTHLYSESSTFIETEQSLLFGHWFHPTPKSRQGMAGWQHQSYAPELKGSFQLHYFGIHHSLIKEDSLLDHRASELVRKSLHTLHIPEDMVLLPMHPLQAQWLLQQEYVKEALREETIKDLGPMGANYTATSSLRTVYNASEDFMYKFSIPVKVTNSLRVNQLHELKAGMVMAKLVRKSRFLERYPSFNVLEDPAYMTVSFPNQRESGFEVILRENQFPTGKDQGISSIAAIVQDPLPHHSSTLANLITKLAFLENRPCEEVSLDWFEKYWNCAIEPLIRLYDEHGIALEAHQQNSVLDLSEGYPKSYYYRDNQGYYLSKSLEKELRLLEPSLLETPELFYEDEIIQERFTYYLFMNQLFSVIYRFGADSLIEEDVLLTWSKERLQQVEKELSGCGKEFVHSILHKPKLSYKANLLTRLHDVDELTAELEQAIYTKIDNPFTMISKEEERAKVISYIS
ncbi:IucA/IucC family protein [Bacillus weihaiensis]|uniref:Siderophore biosynthesis protein n=1 Tax=Bacillus weihaiensis TaxID=1547283 RepID=A0A1L3MVW4_9BACI|nr:IucA/IucC family protein [Bacillus weihaiensis]APH06473.1 siderophore biosynthesis protein [Bacillus weihaiensis]